MDIFRNLSQSAREALFDSIRRNNAEVDPTGLITAANGLLVGSAGNTVSQVLMAGVTLSPTAIGGATTVEQTFAIPMAITTSDTIFVNKPTAQAGLVIGNVRVSAASTLAIQFTNVSTATITPTATELYKVIAMK